MAEIAAGAIRVSAPAGVARRWVWAWLALTAGAVLLYGLASWWPWAVQYPDGWVVPVRSWISAFMKWLINDFNLGLFTFKEMTRSLAWLLEQPLEFVSGVLADGFSFSPNPGASVVVPRLSWLAVSGALTLAGLWAGGAGLAALVAGSMGYLVVFGQWDSAMVTLSSIVIAAPLGAIAGLAVGIAGFRSPRLETFLMPVLDLMQTVPVFAYLVPVLFLFGFGPVAAMIATMIYATPPMVRITMLALKQVPEDRVEFGRMAGCSRRQLLWRVQLPSALPGVMVGVNQVIMLSLNMVIIASMIGAGGLGFDVLTSLRRLAIGNGLEAGVAITLLAVVLDRLSQAMANRPPPGRCEARQPLWRRHPYLAGMLVLIAATWVLGTAWPALNEYPPAWQVTTAPYWDALMSWINIHFFDQIDAVKAFLLLNLMIPFKRLLLATPWLALVAAVALAGWQLGGRRLMLIVSGLALFIVVTGLWGKAMVTLYLCGISVLFAAALGIPIGIWSARNERVHAVVQVIIDTLQTLPSFVYLIPVVMLFRVGDFSAMLAVIAYAIVPAVRYTDHGIRRVPAYLVEAATAMGCTRRQLLRRVQLPIALPEIMLGINQTIMMALSMLVITALVGTRDLGQEVYIALTKADTGRGIVAGVCVACLAMIADRLISAWAVRRKRVLGLG